MRNDLKRERGTPGSTADQDRKRRKRSDTAASGASPSAAHAQARASVGEIEIVFEPDAELLATTGAELDPAPDLLRRGHYVIDPGALRAAVGDILDPDEAEPTSTEEATRLHRLRRLAADPDALFKPHLIANAALIRRLENIRIIAPNAGDAIDVLVGAARISALTDTPFELPALLLLGPAGCGKTNLVREIGGALATTVLTLLGSTVADASPFFGSGVGWKGAGPGRVAETLIAAKTSAPLIFIDEIEKMRLWDRRENASDILLGLLDRKMTAEHLDLYDRVPMRAERVIWTAAANSLENLSAPVLDRCLIVEIRPPGRDERREIVPRIHAETRERLGLHPD